MTRTALAEKLGYKRPSSISNVLSEDRKLLLENYVKMLNALGYDVVVRNQFDKKDEKVVTPE